MRSYLDHNAGAPQRPEALRARQAASEFGNPSSVHWAGRRARELLDEARERTAAVLRCRPRELVFTSGGSESNALALWGSFLGRRESDRRLLVVSALEHPSVLGPLEGLGRLGAQIDLFPVGPDGRLDPDAHPIPDRTLLVSLMLANNETGAVQPVAALAERARAVGARIHCDAIQAAGRLPVRPEELGVDLLSLSGHKFGAGPGAGILYVRDGIDLAPLAAGHQEGGRRAGTQDVPACLALAVALEAAERERETEAIRLLALRQRLEEGLTRMAGVTLIGTAVERLCNTVNARFAGAPGEALLIALDLEGIAVSSGAACASGTIEPSHVLLAMGIPPAEARTSLRFSLGAGNTPEEIDHLLALLPPLVAAARNADGE